MMRTQNLEPPRLLDLIELMSMYKLSPGKFLRAMTLLEIELCLALDNPQL